MDLLLNITTEPNFKKFQNKKETVKKEQNTGYNKKDSIKKRNKYSKESIKSQDDNKESEIIKEESINKHDGKVSTQFISSLFKHNPEIPEIKLTKVKQKSEQLFSTEEFKDLSLHPHLVACLKDRFSILKMTSVQQKTIPHLLKGKDALVKSATGSGKTLAYAVPIMQKLQNITPKLQRSDGIHALIIVPTRELAIQTYECFEKLSRAFTWIVPGYLIGGEKKKSEKARIRKGLTILISTPGRLLDHLDHTANLSFNNVRWLIIDEADRLFELGFEQSISKIITQLKEHCEFQRQTVLLSATLSKDVERLAGISLVSPAIIDASATSYEEVMNPDEFVVASCLQQYFIVTPIKLRLVCLTAFIIEKCTRDALKALIFMSTQDIVDFHHLLFTDILGKLLKQTGTFVQFLKLHGNMSQEERLEIFKKFRDVKAGILLCTDVAARGLDLPKVDWIIQYSAPCRTEEYVHRVGRTARIGSNGQSLLFLLPSEMDFLKVLQEHKISLKDVNMKELLKAIMLLEQIAETGRQNPITVEEHATCLQMKYENYVYGTPALHDLAKKAFTSYARSYSSYPKSLKKIFSVKTLHLGHVAKSFCLRESPSELGMQVSGSIVNEKKKRFNSSNSVKRKFSQVFSEFDSGLEYPRKKKSNQVYSEFDSGLEPTSKKTFNQTYVKSNNSLKPSVNKKSRQTYSEFDSGL